MSNTLLPSWREGVRRGPKFLSEVIRVTGAYLGVAVLACVVMVLTVPALRDQAVTLHKAALTALMPDGIETMLPALGPSGLVPELRSIDLAEVPYRRLLEAKPEPPPPEAVERTPPVGLLGNVPVPKIEAAKETFELTEQQLKALEHYIARKYRVARQVVDRIVESALVTGADLKVNPVLILAVMSVESRFNPYAESGAGAQGLMQVMTRVHTDKFEKLGTDGVAAFHPEINIRVGAQILSDCIRRRGSESAGLRCYVGATGPDDGGYTQKVQAERRRMALAAKIPLN
jgi:hypothetical protein